jgi:hypothetical protein
MAITVDWMDEAQTLVHQHFKGAFTLEEYGVVERETYALIAAVPHLVDVVCDLSEARHLPSNLASLSHRPSQHPPPNLGVTIIVGAPLYIRKLAEFAGKLRIERDAAVSHPNIFVDTMADARAYLAEQRADHL